METWKDITGFEGKYQISNNGNVSSYLSGKILKPQVNRQGYLVVNLYYEVGKARKFRIHRLVAEHFIPNPDNKPFVNHLDGDKSNNDEDNLEWSTSEENNRHARENGLANWAKGEQHGRCKLSDADIFWIRSHYQPRNREFGQAALARMFGVSQPHISYIINGHKR
ncbi:HNH endonuclease [Salmonella enterica]|nr:HNH endonuclease [Salmonella enterica]WKV24402.1 DNA endonuclease [Escherichia phage SUT_E1620]WMM34860.1 DNA endonuclease [Salmonella phage EH1]WMM35322.1 DNA endonuclease [Salmonella phage EH7]EJP0904588.1 HNH endonuclease [Salmonella enterica]